MKKIYLLAIILLNLAILSAKSQKILYKLTGLGYPKNVKEVLERLNSWDKKEIDAFERPEAYFKYKVNIETKSLIDNSKELLSTIEVKIYWDKEKMKYKLVKQ